MASTRFLSAFLVALLILPPSSLAQPAATAITLGAVFDKLMDEVNTAIITARNSGDMVMLQAAQQLKLLIQQFQQAYQDDLQITFDNYINPTIKNTVQSLQAAANDILTKATKSVNDSLLRLQQIANTLPFRSTMPQLTKVEPLYIAPSTNGQPVRIRFFGNFIFAGQTEFAPTLTIGGKELHPVLINNQEVDFDVPYSQLFPGRSSPPTSVDTDDVACQASENDDDDSDNLSAVVEAYPIEMEANIDCESQLHHYFAGTSSNVTLNVPWSKPIVGGVLHKRIVSHYGEELNGLPPYPAIYSFVQTFLPSTYTAVKNYLSDYKRQCSTADCGNNDDLDHPYSYSADNGCHIVRNTSGVDFKSKNGDWSGSLVSDDGDTVIYKFTTVHHGLFGSAGDITFAVGFQEICTLPIPPDKQSAGAVSWGPQFLSWGVSHSNDFTPPQIPGLPAGEAHWEIVYETLDGNSGVLNSTFDGKYLSLATGSPDTSGKVPITLKTPNCEDLQ